MLQDFAQHDRVEFGSAGDGRENIHLHQINRLMDVELGQRSARVRQGGLTDVPASKLSYVAGSKAEEETMPRPNFEQPSFAAERGYEFSNIEINGGSVVK